jgi:hypothetical protein
MKIVDLSHLMNAHTGHVCNLAFVIGRHDEATE